METVASQTRSAWRAPSAVLAGERSSRRVVSAMPSVHLDEEEELEDERQAPRRSTRANSFAPARTAWWRPRTTFGRVLLGSGVVAVLGTATALGIVTRNFLVRDPHFRIGGASSIQSSGLGEVNREDVLPVFGEDIGRNIFFVPLSDRRKQLETIPWVQQATVMRYLPNRLSVSIVERTPVALVMQGDQVELADADGVILDMPPAMMARHHYSFPVLTGINAKDPLSARRARMAIYLRFLQELDQNNQHLSEQVSEIDLSDPEDLRATMPAQGTDILAHFGDGQFLHRLQIYQAHIAEWRARYPRLKGVDLRYNGEVPLEMATDGGVAAKTDLAKAEPVKPLATPMVKAPVKQEASAVKAEKPNKAASLAAGSTAGKPSAKKLEPGKVAAGKATAGKATAGKAAAGKAATGKLATGKPAANKKAAAVKTVKADKAKADKARDAKSKKAKPNAVAAGAKRPAPPMRQGQ
jgi:cell division protein FtsQ